MILDASTEFTCWRCGHLARWYDRLVPHVVVIDDQRVLVVDPTCPRCVAELEPEGDDG